MAIKKKNQDCLKRIIKDQIFSEKIGTVLRPSTKCTQLITTVKKNKSSMLFFPVNLRKVLFPEFFSVSALTVSQRYCYIIQPDLSFLKLVLQNI